MGRSGEANQVQTRRKRRRAKHFTAPATRSIALDGNSGMSTNGERHSGPVESGIQQHGAPEDSTAHTSSLPTKSGELISAVESTDQADSRLRPFRRRAFNTARPARVDMRARKPCFTDRRFLLGWYVRFTTDSSIPDDDHCRRETPGSGQFVAIPDSVAAVEGRPRFRAQVPRLRG